MTLFKLNKLNKLNKTVGLRQHPGRPCETVSNRGTTLIEALLAVGIIAILLSMALPDLQQLRIRQQGTLALRKLASSIYLARSAAAEFRSIAVICPSVDGAVCGGDWHEGVLVFLDGNDNQSFDTGDKRVDYLQYEKLPGTLHWRAFRSKPYLQITPVGFTRYQNGNFTWCDLQKSPENAHQLILSKTGRVRFAKDSNGDGLRENSSGKPISCPG
ncbi:MAG: GspH/FimT family pseudopilin [Gammaproteobacteria bacterium]|nr:GspH/FimT family pseudopilin [Gammaproteobacteria bacterium]